MAKKPRLHQYLSKTGKFASKKILLNAISSDLIFINGKPVHNPHYYVSPSDKVSFRGEILLPVTEFTNYILHKPKGYLSSKLSPDDIKRGKKSIFSLFSKEPSSIHQTLFCVGRLDEDTLGLLILTNDGELSHFLSSPQNKVEKEYEVQLHSPLTSEQKRKIETGVTITLEENGVFQPYTTLPAKVRLLGQKTISITLVEGKKREIKRMLETVGNKVIFLKRIRIGNLQLHRLGIPEGKYIKVSSEFILQHLKR